MALYIRKDDHRSKLQEEIAADLRAKAAAREKGEAIDDNNLKLEHDAHENYLKNSKASTKMLGVWLALGIVGVTVVIYLVIQSS